MRAQEAEIVRLKDKKYDLEQRLLGMFKKQDNMKITGLDVTDEIY